MGETDIKVPNDETGSEMKISKRVKEGDVLHKERPFVYVLSSKVRTEYCDLCFSKGEFLKCSGCQYVHYCNRACQREGWSFHKYECKSLKRVSPRIIPDSARFLARLIRKLQTGGDQVLSYYTETSFRMYKDLMSHYSDLKNDKRRIEHFTSLCAVLSEMFADESLPNSVALMGMYGRMCINSFNICNQEMVALGTGIYLGASVVDHSCRPNAVAVFEGTTLYIRALQTMPYLNWSEIFISYIDLMNTTSDRRDELLSLYYFFCNCPGCLEVEPVGVTGAACPDRRCDGVVEVTNSSPARRCGKCGAEASDDFVETFRDVMEFTENQLQTMKDLVYLDVCKVCLKRQNGVLYKYNIRRVKTLDLAFETSINLGKFDDARAYGIELVECYERYYPKIHPLSGLLYLKLGKLLAYENDLDRALVYLRKAYEILKITHGPQSSLFRCELLKLLNEISAEITLSKC